jgi:hypothetical protein
MGFFKRIISISIFIFLTVWVMHINAQTGIRNNGAILKVNENAFLKVSGDSRADFNNQTSNSKAPQIDLDGIIELDGDWSNNSSSGIFINSNTTGKIVFTGSASQTIGGSNSTTFENLELNNASGLVLNTNTTIDKELLLSNGLIEIKGNNLVISESGKISGSHNSSTMIVADGAGQLRKAITGNLSFTFPVGDNSDNPEYTPVSFTLNNSGGLSSAWIGVNVTDAQHPNDTSPSEYLSRYWTIDANGIDNPDYDVTFNYLQSDVNGNESDVFNAKYQSGSATVYGRVDSENNQLVYSGLSEFSDFTGIAGLVEIVPSSSGEWNSQVGNTYGYTNVIIPKDVLIEQQASGEKDSLNNLIIKPGGSLTVNSTLDITSNLIIQSDETATGSLIDKGNLLVQGIAHVNRYLAANSTANNWRHVSSPVKNATANDIISQNLSENYLYWWNEQTGDYQWVNNQNEPLKVMRGYGLASASSRTVTFKGVPNSGIIDTTLTRSEDVERPGFNLVGNPYPSTINWSSLGWSNTNINSTIWYQTDGNFAAYNRTAHLGTNGGQEYIPPMQAFWVKVNDGYMDGILKANSDVQTHRKQVFYKKHKQENDHVLRIVAQNGNYEDEMIIAFFANASNYFDEYDSEKMFATNDNFAQLYMIVEGRKIAINGMEPPPARYDIPVGIKTPKEGEFKINAANIGQFNNDYKVILEDNFENKSIDLRQNSTYTFTSSKTDTNARFVLHIGEKSTDTTDTGIPNTKGHKLSVYSHNDDIIIDINDDYFTQGKTNVKIFNEAGVEVYNNLHHLNSGRNEISPALNTGYYIIQLINQGKTETRKIYLKKNM